MGSSVLLLSAGRHADALYLPLTKALAAHGLELVHCSVDQVIDLDPATFTAHEAVWVALEPELFSGAPEAAVAAQFLDLVAGARVAPSLALLAPTGAQDTAELLALIDSLCLSEPGPSRAEDYAEALSEVLAHPFGAPGYSTTLLVAEGPEPKELALGSRVAALLRDDGKSLLVANLEALTATSITESFRSLPIAEPLRTEAEAQLPRTVAQLLERAPQPMGEGAPLPRLVSAPKLPRKTGWAELAPFEPGADPASAQRFMRLLERARLDTLWLSISPNQYYRPGARFEEKTQAMEASVQAMSRALAEQAARTGRPAPRVLVALHPASNLRCPPFPAQMARDLYQRDYPDLPAPLFEDFWEQEVVEPAEHFAERWARLSEGLPLGGVVIDLELYLRPLTGVSEFRSTMGFEDATVARSPIKRFDAQGIGAHFGWLEREAERLSATMAARFRRAIPGALVAAYAPAISLDWFYRGFYRGLSAAGPFPLYTFTGDVRPHLGALEDAGISAQHAGVLMLSKLRRPEDAGLFAAVLQRNHGIWLNRCSRVDAYDPTAWHRLEQSPLSFAEREQAFEVLGGL